MYKRFVEIGRVVLINEGPDQGKLCVIIDVVDQRRVSPFLVLPIPTVYMSGP